MSERAAAWLDASLRHRLWFAETDDHDTAGLPFGLCGRGDRAVVRNVACGVTGGHEIRLFDLEVWIEDGGSGNASSQNRIIAELIEEALGDGMPGHRLAERWECAIVRAGAECGRLSIAPEGVLTRLADMATFRDQDLELEAFNRAFEIRTTDRRFASDFLDARMADFLFTHAAGCVVETVGNRILVAQPACDPPDVDGIASRALGVAERVPNAVRALAPALPSAALTPGCPIGPDGRPRADAFASAADDDDGWVRDPGGWASDPHRSLLRSRGEWAPG
ncbi:MAG: hypothetical protein ACXWFU_04115 [Actinomycetota bacterium]